MYFVGIYSHHLWPRQARNLLLPSLLEAQVREQRLDSCVGARLLRRRLFYIPWRWWNWYHLVVWRITTMKSRSKKRKESPWQCRPPSCSNPQTLPPHTSSYISWICQRDKKLRNSWSRFSGNPAGGNITGQIFSLKYLPALEFIHNIHWQISTLQSMNHTFEKAHIFKFSQMDEMNVVI